MTHKTSNAVDPFAHLHDENYDAPYVHPRCKASDMVTMAGRQTVSLNGAWRFTRDLFAQELRQKWFAQPPPASNPGGVPGD